LNPLLQQLRNTVLLRLDGERSEKKKKKKGEERKKKRVAIHGFHCDFKAVSAPGGKSGENWIRGLSIAEREKREEEKKKGEGKTFWEVRFT